MDSMYEIFVDGKKIFTNVTANPVTIDGWVQSVTTFFESKSTLIVGLDAEWNPNRRRGDDNPVATLQLCAGNRCLIVQLCHIWHLPQSLQNFLSNPRHVFAGVEVARDVAKLSAHYGLQCASLYDVRDAALQIWPSKVLQWPGLKELAGTVVGIEMVKPRWVTVSDWEAPVLTPQQIEYACVDAYASCRIGVTLYFNYDWFIQQYEDEEEPEYDDEYDCDDEYY